MKDLAKHVNKFKFSIPIMIMAALIQSKLAGSKAPNSNLDPFLNISQRKCSAFKYIYQKLRTICLQFEFNVIRVSDSSPKNENPVIMMMESRVSFLKHFWRSVAAFS